MKVDFIKAPISAAIRTDKDFSAALRSQVDMVFFAPCEYQYRKAMR